MSLIEDAGDAFLAASLANDSARARGEYVPSAAAFEFVQYALRIGALELVPEGRKLKNGRISPYFFNSALFKTGDALSRLAGAYAPVVYKFGERPDVLFGPAYKGIPLVAAIAVVLGNSIEFAFNRKEAKDHGEGGLLVGASLQGKKVLIVDDVITSGVTKKEAMEFVRQCGGTPVGLAIAFDRQERGAGDLSAAQEFEQMFGIPLVAAATLDDLLSVLEKNLDNDSDDGDAHRAAEQMLTKIIGYNSQYGVHR